MGIGLFRVLGMLLFVYLVWRKLRDDYPEADLVAYGWVALLGFSLIGRIAFGLSNWGVWNENWLDWLLWWEKPGSSLGWSYLGLLLASWWWVRIKEWKLWSFLEDIVPMVLVLMFWVTVGEVVASWLDWRQILLIGVWLLAGVVSWWFGGRYRSFVWYRSGKKGFVFLVVNILIWLSWAGLSANYWKLFLGLISGVGLVMLGDVLVSLKVLMRRK